MRPLAKLSHGNHQMTALSIRLGQVGFGVHVLSALTRVLRVQ